MEKRIRVLMITFAVVIGLLVCRLAYIQLIGHDDLQAAARAQQEITLQGADTRGMIYDRNGTPVAGGNREYIYIIEADRYDGETCNALDKVNATEVCDEKSDYKVFISEEYDKKAGERLINNSGAYILEAERRYQKDQPAAHIIGYVNTGDNKGASGLELQYDEELGSVNKKVSAPADVYGNILQGYGLTVTRDSEKDSSVKDGIITTLDLRLQKIAENALGSAGKNGAVIILEAKSGDIVAAASTPVFDPEEPEKYMESKNGELINKVTQGVYPPGSVFKIIVTAAALEAGIRGDQEFECEGRIDINGHEVKCSTGGETGHGKISFTNAFAQSCNCAFVEIGQMIGAERIISMAERMGLGKTVLEGYPEEKSGSVMNMEQSEGAAIANLAIGQGETLVTPLQIAQMTAVIANGGENPKVNIILDNEDENTECISRGTAEAVGDMMREAALNGTGKDLVSSAYSAIKTGSAESVQAGKDVIHGWITGYLPTEDPQYVITVFIEDGKSGRGSAGPVFSQIAEEMVRKNIIEYETSF